MRCGKTSSEGRASHGRVGLSRIVRYLCIRSQAQAGERLSEVGECAWHGTHLAYESRRGAPLGQTLAGEPRYRFFGSVTPSETLSQADTRACGRHGAGSVGQDGVRAAASGVGDAGQGSTPVRRDDPAYPEARRQQAREAAAQDCVSSCLGLGAGRAICADTDGHQRRQRQGKSGHSISAPSGSKTLATVPMDRM